MRNFQKNSAKNPLAIFYKISLAICLTIPLFSCYFFENKNSVASNENLGEPSGDYSYLGDPNVGVRSLNETSVSMAKYVEGSKDIPLAGGLKKVSEDGLDFDSASGSIIAVTYKSSDDLKKVQDFYNKTLPQLGWKKIVNAKSSDDLIKFRRDNEKLEIEFLNYNGDDLVKFFVETVSK